MLTVLQPVFYYTLTQEPLNKKCLYGVYLRITLTIALILTHSLYNTRCLTPA